MHAIRKQSISDFKHEIIHYGCLKDASFYRGGAWNGGRRAALVAIIVHLFVLFFEEPSLRGQFGESYESYLRAVPRWLPRVPRSDLRS